LDAHDFVIACYFQVMMTPKVVRGKSIGSEQIELQLFTKPRIF
jgi:hypothetical protein